MSQTKVSNASALIVEDDVFIVGFIETVLQDAGFGRIETALTLKDAQGALDRSEGFDVIVLDARLPDGDATTLARHLLADGQCIVFHSGQVDCRLVASHDNATFCQKPATPEQLLRRVRDIL